MLRLRFKNLIYTQLIVYTTLNLVYPKEHVYYILLICVRHAKCRHLFLHLIFSFYFLFNLFFLFELRVRASMMS